MRFALALLLGAAAAAAEDDPVTVLMRLRDRVLEQGQRIPNHTCVETVERLRYRRVAEQATHSCDTILARRKLANFSRFLRLDTTDRLRLDVALSTEHELYSWAGAERFDAGVIDDLIPEGAMGTGAFATLLLAAFERQPPRFTFEGETYLDVTPAFEYSFHVGREDSHYTYRYNRNPATFVGHSGMLLVAPETSALIRFTIRTDELPPSTEACEVDTTLDYGNVHLGGADFLLPTATRQRFIGRDGTESENRYEFSSCRDFQAESKVRFGEKSAPSGTARRPGMRPSQWPNGLQVAIQLATDVDTYRAAAGDRIEGRLALTLPSPDGGPSFPRGTVVAGRLMRVEVRHRSPAEAGIALRWETLDPAGRALPLSLTPNRTVKPGLQFGGLAAPVGLLLRRGKEIELPRPGEERYATLSAPGEHHVFGSGLLTQWLTILP
jgi:hypothetical protein